MVDGFNIDEVEDDLSEDEVEVAGQRRPRSHRSTKSRRRRRHSDDDEDGTALKHNS